MMEVVKRSRFRVAPYQYYARTGSGHTPSRGNDEYWVDCDVPWVTTADVKRLRDGRTQVLNDSEHQISRLGLNNSAARLHPAGTVVLSRTASVGFSAIMGVPMATSQDFVTWSPDRELDSLFFLWVLRAMKGAGDLDSLMYGSTHKTIYVPDLRQLRGPLPPFDVQRRIADYLDTEAARIDTLIAKSEHAAALLRERLASAIDHAFSGGPLRRGWAAPEDWPLRPLSSLSHTVFADGDWVESPYITDHGVRLIQTGNIGVGAYREQGFRYIAPDSFTELGCTEVKPGDVLICRLADPIGRACLAPDLGIRMITSVDVTILRCDQDALPAFLVEALSSSRWLALMEREGQGGTRSRIARLRLGEMRVPVPPRTDQKRVIAELRAIRRDIASSLNALECQRALLLERRQALIMAAVTGEFEI